MAMRFIVHFRYLHCDNELKMLCNDGAQHYFIVGNWNIAIYKIDKRCKT